MMIKLAAVVHLGALSAVRGEKVAAMVGDMVCVEGYIMDNFCIDEGFLFDNKEVRTLSAEGPEVHSVHCLVDPPQCPASGYVVLTASEDGFCQNFAIDLAQSGDMVTFITDTAAMGACNNCTNAEGTVSNGFRATVQGTVTDAGDDHDNVAVLGDVTILDSSVGCGDEMAYSTFAIDCMLHSGEDEESENGDPAPAPAPTMESGASGMSMMVAGWLLALAMVAL